MTRHLAAVPERPACPVCGGERRVIATGVPGGIAVVGARTIPCPACTSDQPLIDLKETYRDHH